MQSLIVKKFGGTSVGTLERIRIVADQLIQTKQAEEKLVVVVSAMSGETDRLLNLAYELCPNPSAREIAAMITTGEQVSAALLAMALCEKGMPAKSFNAAQLSILTDAELPTKARITKISAEKISAALANNQILVVTGFQGVTESGDITALGRGGSDTSAVALACALSADECQIYTDVDGIYTADPRLVPNAYRVEQIPFAAMMTLAKLGSKVLQWRSVALAGKYQIPLRVLSSFKEGKGTLMHYDQAQIESAKFSGLSHQMGLTRWIIKIKNPQGNELSLLAESLAQQQVLLESIHQTQIHHAAEISLLFSREENAQATVLLNTLCEQHHWSCEAQHGFARISLVGIGLSSNPEVAASFFAALSQLNIPIQETLYSELSLSAIIPDSELPQAARALHKIFFESSI
ncbi:MAG: aspartate kinase [Gammaproteobacteria bacterium]|jgi:aspartate kinase|nr:aspartate kinase [Gammaproteobacteria bacterium]